MIKKKHKQNIKQSKKNFIEKVLLTKPKDTKKKTRRYLLFGNNSEYKSKKFQYIEPKHAHTNLSITKT